MCTAGHAPPSVLAHLTTRPPTVDQQLRVRGAPIVAIGPDLLEERWDDLVCALSTASTDDDPADTVTYWPGR